MKKAIFLLFLTPSILFANEITDYKCQKLQKDKDYLGIQTQRCENKEVVCYESKSSFSTPVTVWCYRK